MTHYAQLLALAAPAQFVGYRRASGQVLIMMSSGCGLVGSVPAASSSRSTSVRRADFAGRVGNAYRAMSDFYAGRASAGISSVSVINPRNYVHRFCRDSILSHTVAGAAQSGAGGTFRAASPSGMALCPHPP